MGDGLKRAFAAAKRTRQPDHVRLGMVLSADMLAMIDGWAEREGCDRAEILRRGLSVLKALEDQIGKGRPHLVFTSEPSADDVELVGVLSPSALPASAGRD